jgi:gamma-carbonic anhydrase
VLVEHRGARPTIHPSAWVAPTAALVGDVRIGAESRVLWHAVLTAEDGRIDLGERCVVMEHALIRAREAHPAVVGDDVMIAPNTHVNGARLGDGAFIATGAGVFPGAVVGSGATVAINGIVHVNTELGPRQLDFFTTVYGVPREAGATERMRRQAAWFVEHRDDRVL